LVGDRRWKRDWQIEVSRYPIVTNFAEVVP
jgi:hypothetical protein